MSNSHPENTHHLTQFGPDNEDDVINLGEFLSILLDGKGLILAITFFVFLLGIGKAFIDTPIYKVDVMLQVNEKSQSMAGVEPLIDMFGTKLPVMAEIELIKSRKVLGAVINNLELEVIAKPKFFPFVGEAIARRFAQSNPENAVSSPLFGQDEYAWGGEAIQVGTLAVPEALRDKEFTLLAGNQGQFQLFFNDELIAEGEVGKPVNWQIDNHQQPIHLFVSLLKARPGTQFTLIRQSANNAIWQLRNSLTVSEKGKNTGILELTLESDNAEYAIRVLNEIANIYVQQNVEYKSAESQKTLEFLDKQLPIIKDQMEASITALNEYKNQKGSVNLDIETQHTLAGVVEIKTQITLLQQKRDELRQKFTESHPNIIAVDKQIARLQAQLQSHNQMIKALPETQQIILELSGDVKVGTNLYSTLLNNAQTLRVAKAGTVGDVRVIDYAVLPDKAIKPNKPLIIGVAFVLGLFLGIVAVFVRKSLLRGIEDPDLIEKQLHIPVYATIYHSKDQDLLNKELSKSDKSIIRHNRPAILSLRNRDDVAIESLRSLRTTIHFSLLEAQNNIIVIAGPSPGVGKSFVAANLAIVMADAGKKILLIDADMRKGEINKAFGVARENGLSEVILNTRSVQDATREIPSANIDFIPTGTIPPNPSELLLHERFGQLLDGLTKQYDLIIIDSPPILAVTDAAIISRLAGAALMVIKAGSHTKRELEQSIKRFSQSGTPIKGIVFNDMPQASSRYGYGYHYGKYVYQYRYQKSK
ncbi:polysaccharide biosynthesis tyrosine autokinase [Nitrosomonas oligotropha]|uniref:Putative tyrosine-protein kinase EpsB n=1 Tax=Nitrosomonas oligotropha TaxID=42354 RepID=A0A1H8PKH6_9PROT|nr:polysaccharide biosynthesis tyrosine autokinase [Nitrosomonas oligotropha]SDX40609.1 tyrosine-protein kinase Etk/Wzc [Nitrosomonas oligotropha]SEO42509.1 tyrosine-protein kinase Etk/Wzc [Nitrosomonas oligotropha]